MTLEGGDIEAAVVEGERAADREGGGLKVLHVGSEDEGSGRLCFLDELGKLLVDLLRGFQAFAIRWIGHEQGNRGGRRIADDVGLTQVDEVDAPDLTGMASASLNGHDIFVGAK